MFRATGVKINLIKEVGELSEKKIEKLTKEFKSFYPTLMKIPAGILLVNNETKQHLFLSSGQITVAQDGTGLNPDFNQLKEVVNKIFDIFMLDTTSDVILNFTGVLPSEVNTMGLSLGFLDSKKQAKLDEVPEIKGLGLRFIYDFEHIKGDFRIEPLIRDPKYFFLQLDASFNSNTIEQIFENAQKMYGDFSDRLSRFAINITK